MEKRRLKKKWRAQFRAEWEAEQAAGSRRVTPEEVRASIDAKVQGLRRQAELERQRQWEQMSEETRTAWERFEELRDRDFERLEADEAMRRRLLEGPRKHVNAEPPVREPKPPKVRKTVHGLKDDGLE